MNENEFNNEQNFGNQSPSLETNKSKKNPNKKNILIPLMIILVVLFILFKDMMLQLLGVILIIICIGFAFFKAIKYIISFGGCLFNIIISMLAFLLIIAGIGWVMEIFG